MRVLGKTNKRFGMSFSEYTSKMTKRYIKYATLLIIIRLHSICRKQITMNNRTQKTQATRIFAENKSKKKLCEPLCSLCLCAEEFFQHRVHREPQSYTEKIIIQHHINQKNHSSDKKNLCESVLSVLSVFKKTGLLRFARNDLKTCILPFTLYP